jgi:hypothetical protein
MIIVQKSEKNLFEMFGNNSNKIYTEPSSFNPSSSISHLPGAFGVLTGPGAALVMRDLEKFSRMKNRDEIIAEINRLKEEKVIKEVGLSCLENVLFAVNRESESSPNSTNYLSAPKPPAADITSPASPAVVVAATSTVGNSVGAGTGSAEILQDIENDNHKLDAYV